MQKYYIEFKESFRARKTFASRNEALDCLSKFSPGVARLSYKYSDGVFKYDGVTAYYDEEGRLHREDGPAYFTDELSQWWNRGKTHRVGGPAVEAFRYDIYANKHVKYLEEWHQNGEIHRLNGPAITRSYFDINFDVIRIYHEWIKEGKPHRIGGPYYYSFSKQNGGGIKSIKQLEWAYNGKTYREEEEYIMECLGQFTEEEMDDFIFSAPLELTTDNKSSFMKTLKGGQHESR